MATDYDTRRDNREEEIDAESLQELKARRDDKISGVVDVDDAEIAEQDLPDADLSGQELTVTVMPRQLDEFVCSHCFLVKHRSQLAKQDGSTFVCRDCAD